MSIDTINVNLVDKPCVFCCNLLHLFTSTLRLIVLNLSSGAHKSCSFERIYVQSIQRFSPFELV